MYSKEKVGRNPRQNSSPIRRIENASAYVQTSRPTYAGAGSVEDKLRKVAMQNDKQIRQLREEVVKLRREMQQLNTVMAIIVAIWILMLVLGWVFG